MKNTNLIFKLFCAVMVTASAVTACYDDMTDVPTVKLASIDKEYIISAARTLFDIEIYANGPYHIEVDGEPDWLTLTPGEMVDGRATISAECLANSRFKRAALFVLCSDLDTRRDTVTIKQEGVIDPYIEFDDASVIISQDAGVTVDSLRTNVLSGEMTFQINYENEGEEWVTGLEIVNTDSDASTLHITARANADEYPRIAAVVISFTDGWGDVVEVDFNVVQLNVRGEMGNVISFEEFRDNYADLGVVNDFVLLEGYVVSNTESHNAGEAEQTLVNTLDRLPTYTTVYLESIDGKSGLKFVTPTLEDNIFDQFDHVTILMRGSTPTLKTCGATRLDVEGVTRTMVLSRVSGTKDDIPVKNKTINTLSDDDIYTYVSLNDVELPFRRGSLMPVDQNFTCAGYELSMSNVSSASGAFPKFGTLVRGKDGGSLYMWTNDNCDYRNEGRRLPQGSGVLSGVIVHERYAKYEWANGADPVDMDYDESLGNVGRYQIRHQSAGDIWDEMNMDFKDSFSEMLCEYRMWSYEDHHVFPTYCKEDISGGYDDYLKYKNGWLTHTYQTAYTGSSSKNDDGHSKTHLYGGRCYDYLGPFGKSDNHYFGANWGNKNGCGMVVDPAHDYIPRDTDVYYDRISYNPDGTIEYFGPYAPGTMIATGTGGWVSNEYCVDNNPEQINYVDDTNRGKGWLDPSCYAQFEQRNWWDYDTDRFYSFLLKFSTMGISTDQLSMQIGVFNRFAPYGAPKYWRAEWAYTDSQDPEDDEQWTLIAEYTVPDYFTSPYTWYSFTGYKPLNFVLPLEILGHEEVFIRLHPINDLCYDEIDYANGHICDYTGTGSGQHTSALNYIAIRYNK